MPDSTLASLTSASTLDGTELVYVVQSSANAKATTANVKDYVLATPVTVVGNASAGSQIRLVEDTDNGTNYVALKAPDTLSGNLTLTLPSADGTNGQVLQTNGSGVLSFVAASGGGVLNNFAASAAPTVGDDSGDGYAVGSRWLWAARGFEYVCMDATLGAAKWEQVTSRLGPRNGVSPRILSWHTRAYDAGQSRWQTNNTGNGGSLGVATTSTSGLSARTGTSTNGFSRFINTLSQTIPGATVLLRYEAVITFAAGVFAAPDGTDTWHFQCGYYQSGSQDVPGNNFAMFHWRWNGSAAEFLARTRNAGGTVQNTTLTAPTSGQTIRFRVEIDYLTETRFYMDGTLVATHSTSPAESSLFEVTECWKSAGASDRGVNILEVSAAHIHEG